MKSRDPSRPPTASLLISTAGLLFLQPLAHAYDLNDKLSIGGILAGAGQCQTLDEGAGKRDACRGALPIRPHLSFRPTEQDELHVELGLAAGNGLNKVSPFQLAPWAADLEDDVKDVNGRGRSYLLTAWYRHSFQLAPDNRLSTTLGLIDSTDFLDNNAFANDEYTQFMNEALVNSSQTFLPSYDRGAAAQWDLGPWSLRAVYMNVGKDEDEDEDGKVGRLANQDISDDYDYVGAEIGYSLQTVLGKGNYRLVLHEQFALTSDLQYMKDDKNRGRRRRGSSSAYEPMCVSDDYNTMKLPKPPLSTNGQRMSGELPPASLRLARR